MLTITREKERKEDEKRLEKLYKDVTTGLLRKKRGGDLDDLDDSDDEIMERRRRKQEEFARMRRALLADEKIGEIGGYSLLLLLSRELTILQLKIQNSKLSFEHLKTVMIWKVSTTLMMRSNILSMNLRQRTIKKQLEIKP